MMDSAWIVGWSERLAPSRPARAPGGRAFTGRHMLGLVLAFFGVIIAVNVTMAVLAGRTWTGLIVTNSYVESQHYNERLAAARRQAALGWHSDITATASGLTLTMRGRDGVALSGLQVTVRLARPTHEHDDRTMRLEERQAGRYHAEGGLAPGLWLADIEATDAAGRRYARQVRVIVQGGG